MYKTYKFIKTSTAGNRTGYILGKKAFENKKEIMDIILNKINLEAEQYAFLWKEGGNCVMNMAGGELSGGAVLASPIILENFTGNTNVITVGNKLETIVTNKGKNKIYVQTTMPLSMIVSNAELIIIECLGKITGYRIVLEGIVYFVTKEPIQKEKNIELFKNLDIELETKKSPCLGIIEIPRQGKSKPTVWIKDVGTITEEQGCTTGTISAQLCFPERSGWWKQPSGESIKASITDENIQIESPVERLSDGKVYLSN